jgi:cell division protein FtsN
MESKNLNDIVIDDNSDSKKAQLKNILTLLALLFIILVISIVITKIILGEDEENNDTLASANGVTAVAQQNVTNSDSSPLGTGAAILGAGAAAVGANALLSNSKKGEQADVKTALKEQDSNKKVPLRDQHKEVKRHIVKKHIIRRKEYKEVKRHTPKVHTTPKNIVKKYYVKVGTFKDPDNAIKLIKARGLHYKTTKTDSGATRVLVGPYASASEARKDLSQVKKIAPDAFITKLN